MAVTGTQLKRSIAGKKKVCGKKVKPEAQAFREAKVAIVFQDVCTLVPTANVCVNLECRWQQLLPEGEPLSPVSR
mgnify:CR=1 FL=1